MNIEKASWSTDGSSVRIAMPLQKVDTEKRIVSGFATLDSIDTSDDIVLASASVSAFENFRGNIRLMHQPIPAGKLVNFREEEYYDAATSKFYRGIYVDVYVSKGAPEVWEMVLDGTLTGFSIGGSITEQESQYVSDFGKTIRFIKSYDLIELSLVDSPANQLCNIFSVQKAANGDTTVQGMITEVQTENVFYCANDQIAFTSSDEAKACNVCGAETKNIGWFESDGGEKTEKVNAIVADFTKATESVEGRENEMADETVVETPEVEEAPVVDETEVVETEDEAVEAPAEEAADETVEVDVVVVEVEEETPETEDEEVKAEEAETPDFTKAFDELSDKITKALENNAATTEAELAKVNDKLGELETVANKIEELGAKHAELAEKFNAIDTQLDSVEKRFAAIDKGLGVKKSGDLGGSKGDKLEKSNTSTWGGRFLGSVDSI